MFTESSTAQQCVQPSSRTIRYRTRSSVGRLSSHESYTGRPGGNAEDTHPTEFTPELTRTAQVDPILARIDRFSGRIGLGFYTTTHSDDNPRMRTALCGPDGKFFCSLPMNGESDRLGLKTRSKNKFIHSHEVGGLREIGQPLFSGRLYLNGHTDNRTEVKFEGSLNPTRAMAHYGTEFPSNAYQPDAALIPLEPIHNIPVCLDGNDNVLPSSFSQSDYLLGEYRYFHEVPAAMAREICRLSQEWNVFVDTSALQLSLYNLWECEVYWEFFQPNARVWLGRNFDRMISFAERWRQTYHRDDEDGQQESDGTEGNRRSFSVVLRLTKAIEIVVYAKCQNRVRFEVRFKRPNSDIVAGRTAPTVEDMVPKLLTLRQKGAERVNHLLSFLGEAENEPSYSIADSPDYSERWTRLVGWKSYFLLRELHRSGVLRKGGLSRAEKSFVKRAIGQGLIEYDRRTKGYHPSRNFMDLTESRFASAMSHILDTQSAIDGDVSASVSTLQSSEGRVPPSPLFLSQGVDNELNNGASASALPPQKSRTIAELCDEYREAEQRAGRSQATMKTYNTRFAAQDRNWISYL